jgi:transcriptional regulator with GAF, ATPase, and Fis domain
MRPGPVGNRSSVEPIPETSEAIEEFGPFATEVGLLEHLRQMGDLVTEIVPDCVGLSLAYREHGVTFTLVASDGAIAALDGLQYLDDGPCVTAVREQTGVLEFSRDDPLAEEAWQLFSRATAARGIASTLTLPIMAGGTAVGSVNLYAATPSAFTGKHEAVADVLGAWAPGADLSFETRRAAEQAPRVLFEETRLQVALGILATLLDVSLPTARDRFANAAERAGVDPSEMAELIIEQATSHARDTDDA